MKSILLACLFFTVPGFSQDLNKANSYTRDDLKNLQWIEGNWMGKAGEKPFYEIYTLVNDSTLAITSYEWDGKDSSQTTRSFLQWRMGSYYLGDSLNWKVTTIRGAEIHMQPHYKASNSIVWKRINKDAWDAILQTKNKEWLYNMQRVHHFDKSRE